MYRFLLVLQLLATGSLSAQHIIEGNVRDSETGEPLAGATASLRAGSDSPVLAATVADATGFFRLISPTTSGQILIRFLGYEEVVIAFTDGAPVSLDVRMKPASTLTEAVIVSALRASEKQPVTFSRIDKTEIRKLNFGQDMPYVLNLMPSVVTTSDAGTGIGYTGMRIRGSDATRINVTLNGIPYNDSESQGVFWVDIPDIASSTQDVQLQRGVGTSSNGAGAFGASVNLQTTTLREKPYAEWMQSGGSFGTLRTTLGAGTGLLNGKYVFDARLSSVKSDGFIDRATSDLGSYYASAGYHGKKTIIKLISFGGKERTYQSWYGVPQSRLENDAAGMEETAATEGWSQDQLDHLLNSGSRTFNFYTYKDQVDDYGQDHLQLHISSRLHDGITGNLSLHRTHGKGYYEEFKPSASLADYGLDPVVVNEVPVTETDLVRRRWLDNDFYGATWSLHVDRESWTSVLGGALNRYDGDHFGEIVRSETTPNAPIAGRYYFNNGLKDDVSIYWKNTLSIHSKIHLFGDLQYRIINHRAVGTENNLNTFDFDYRYRFFNPKGGFTAEIRPDMTAYASLAVARREPVRDDLVDNQQGILPKPEELFDYEAGIRLRRSRVNVVANVYYMYYRNQLVLTGALNDVGANIRTNVPVSYRAGIELEGGYRVSARLKWQGNLTLSRNKIRRFEEVLYDYGDNFDQFNTVRNIYRNTDISFSPGIIGGSQWSFKPADKLELTLVSKYVGSQFLDNTSNSNRSIDAYFLNDLRFTYSFRPQKIQEVAISLLAANLFNVVYESNGYTYGYLGGATTYRQNYYYPQAGRNFLAMLTIRI